MQFEKKTKKQKNTSTFLKAANLSSSSKLLLLLFDTAVSMQNYRRQSDEIPSFLFNHTAAFTIPQTKRKRKKKSDSNQQTTVYIKSVSVRTGHLGKVQACILGNEGNCIQKTRHLIWGRQVLILLSAAILS